MTICLRPHHLLCLLTYVGRGYSPAFVENYSVIAERIMAGEALQIVDGPDDICAPLLAGSHAHCHHASVRERDAQAARDVGRVLQCDLRNGQLLVLQRRQLTQMRLAFAEVRQRTACTGCRWLPLCSGIAADGYTGVRLFPSQDQPDGS